MSETFTLIEQGQGREIRATIADGAIRLDTDVLEDSLGWTLKPEGLCRDALCVPVADRDALVHEGQIDLARFAEALGQPIAIDVAERAAALGTRATDRAAALDGGEAPDFTLPDLEGKLHSLSDHRGKKVLLIAYASW